MLFCKNISYIDSRVSIKLRNSVSISHNIIVWNSLSARIFAVVNIGSANLWNELLGTLFVFWITDGVLSGNGFKMVSKLQYKIKSSLICRPMLPCPSSIPLIWFEVWVFIGFLLDRKDSTKWWCHYIFFNILPSNLNINTKCIYVIYTILLL